MGARLGQTDNRLRRTRLPDLYLFISIQTDGGYDNMAMITIEIAEASLQEVSLSQSRLTSVEAKESALTTIAIAEPKLTGITLTL